MTVKLETLRDKALEVLAAKQRVVCCKTKKTAEHCADREMRAVCHTANEVENFYFGHLPENRQHAKCWYDVVRNTRKVPNTGLWGPDQRKKHYEKEQKRAKKGPKKRKKVEAQ